MRDFGKIKSVFNNILVESIIKKDIEGKRLFKKYLKTIKESEVLKTQFLVYNNLETKVESDPTAATIYVSENIRLLKNYKPSQVRKEINKLEKLLTVRKNKEYVESHPIHESLANIIFTETNANNIDRFSNDIKTIVKHITSNKTKTVNESIDLPPSFLTKLLVDKFNQKYSKLSESDQSILKVLVNSNFEEKKSYYDKMVNECVEVIDKLMSESAEETKEKLNKVKTKLLQENEIKEDQLIDKMVKLVELKDNLSN